MTFQDLQGHDERVGHQIIVDPSMEDLNRAVVRGRGEERVRRMEVQGSDSAGVISVCVYQWAC